MASRPDSRRSRLERWLAERNPAEVDEAARDELASLLAPVSEDYLRDLLRRSGARLAPMVEGVRQDDLVHLRRTLAALAVEYAARPADARKLVIRAKERGKLAARHARDGESRAAREEMVRWMLVWLENPPAFDLWAGIRLSRMDPFISFASRAALIRDE
jgi:hypothetical protein